MAGISLQHVSKDFPGMNRPAVHDLCLDIRDGEFLVLVGPSGSGKSTTLRLIAGLEEVSSGTIRIGDAVVNGLPAGARGIAMVSQNYALLPHLNVYKNLAFALHVNRRRLGLSRELIDARVRDAARMLQIEDLLERRPRALSGGQRQRVALGRAIVRNPQAFLLDEPLSNLDAPLRLETRLELKGLHQRLKSTTVYVTHDQEEAMTLGDRVAVMKDGIIQQCESPLEIYDRPVNRFVAGFMGMPAMNFMAGRVIADAEGIWFLPAFEADEPRMARIRLAAGAAEAARERLSGNEKRSEVVLGIRPEALRPVGEQGGEGGGAETAFSARVSVVEPLGDRVDLWLATGGNPRLICRCDSHEFGKLRPGGIIKVLMDPGRVHLFEPGDNGVNLALTRKTSHAAA